MILGDNIKKIREWKELGLNELARIANMNASYLSAIEQNKKTNPSVKTLEKIADALGVSSKDFFRTEPMSNEESLMESYESSRENRNIIPTKFTKIYEAREYLEMHQILAAEGFDLSKMNDEDVLDFANEMLKQMKLISYKYKK